MIFRYFFVDNYFSMDVSGHAVINQFGLTRLVTVIQPFGPISSQVLDYGINVSYIKRLFI